MGMVKTRLVRLIEIGQVLACSDCASRGCTRITLEFVPMEAELALVEFDITLSNFSIICIIDVVTDVVHLVWYHNRTLSWERCSTR